jgi:hypothetical protein
MTSEQLWAVLLPEIHTAIATEAEALRQFFADTSEAPTLTYPPGVEFSPQETAALRELAITSDAATGLVKLATSACAGPIFQLLTLLDGVADPQAETSDTWLGADLTLPGDGDRPMIHDEFFDSYWSSTPPTAIDEDD